MMSTSTWPQLGDLNAVLDWLRARSQGDLCTDSRRVQPGDVFIAWPGAATDGRLHVAAALRQGACACLVEQAGVDNFSWADGPIATVPGLKALTGPLAAAWYGQPSLHLDVLAVTGTNGKTSTAWWVAQALNLLSNKEQTIADCCGLVGTLGMGLPSGLVSTGLTTPDPVALQKTLRTLADGGQRYCAIEASSIGLEEARLDGTRIRVAVFTNFTQDHLDYHGSMAAYWAAKQRLFDWPGLQAAVINLDDPQGDALAEHALARGLDVWTVSCVRPARLRALGLRYGALGLDFDVQEGALTLGLATPLMGEYNVANLLGVMATLRALGYPLVDIAQVCPQLPPVPGRMENLGVAGQPVVIVDYAHTPDALDKALQALRPLTQQRGGRLWCVFGCGGQRDTGKRPLMAAVAQKRADMVVVTSDNPRHEKPEHIISQILLGFCGGHRQVQVNPDRAAAIAQTLAEAAPEDVVLIAGKGHEATQDIAGQLWPFSDQTHARQALSARAAAQRGRTS